ncbi:CAP domain-containing protein [Blastococcus colisei]|nr:CAP domain-containing protein [Blastococcus colisei]
MTRALIRWARLGRRASGHRGARLALSAALSTVITALVLAVPVMAGTGPNSPVVLGQDGQALSSRAFAGLTSTATFSSTTGEATAAPSPTDAPAGAPTTAPPLSAPLPTTPAVPDPVTSAPAAPPEPAAEPAPEPAAEPADPSPEPPAPAPEAPAPAPVAAAAVPASGGVEDQVLALVNTERAAAGCGPVSADAGLTAVARAHSEDMRDRGFFDHVNLDGLDPFDRADRAGVSARAENIARGQQSAAEVMTSWMNSSGHRANILDCGLTRLGVGVAQGGGGPWWTQLFG